MYLLLLICLVGFAVLAILLRDLLKSAISLAVASIFLAIIFFGLGAPYVGVFEISVVAGLITVLFISTVALTKGEGDVRESKIPTIIFPIFFIIIIIIDIIIMKKLVSQLPVMPNPAEPGSFGQVLWSQRTFDLVGQIAVIFAGVFSVLALFRNRGKDE